MPGLLPYADKLVCGFLRTALPGVEVGTLVPPDLYNNPREFVLAHRVGGAAIDPQFLDRATIDVQTYANSRSGAADLADRARVALFDAYRYQLVAADGHIAFFREAAGPTELRTANQPDSLYRFQATYSLAIRPPRPV